MFENIVVKGTIVDTASQAGVSAAELALGTRFPAGYREYITRFGRGVLGGTYIRIYIPGRIVAERAEWRARIDEYWFWDDGAPVLTKERALECIVFSDTLDGDELIFHPCAPDTIYVLLRQADTIYVAGVGLPAAIEWMCGSGVLTEAFTDRIFEAGQP